MCAKNGWSVALNNDSTASLDSARNTNNDCNAVQLNDMKPACVFESNSSDFECLAANPKGTVFRDKRALSHHTSPASPNRIKAEESESFIETNSLVINTKPTKERENTKDFRTEDTGLSYAPRKNGKSPLVKKRKGGTWYSVLSPTYKSRCVEFKRFFKDIPDSERLVVDYSCAVQKDLLVHGRLYVSQSYLCFYANIFRWATVLKLPFKDIAKLTKEKTAKVIPNAIQVVTTKDDKFFFTSFSARDRLFAVLDRLWRINSSDQILGHRELWQWIHYSYGEDLGLTSNDEDSYCQISLADRMTFQLQLPHDTKSNQSFSNSVTVKDPSDDSMLLSSENSSSLLSVPVQTSPGADHLATLQDNQPSPPPRDENMSAAFDGVAQESSQFSQAGNHEEPMADFRDVSSDVNSDEEADRCCDHDHFSIHVVDEILDIPIDMVFTHCFTDSSLFQDFVTVKKTFDVVLSPWPDESDENGTKVRNIAYTLSLNYSIGPKVSPSTERQIMYPESKPGHFYLIDTECINAGIPYGENFYVVNRYCISKISNCKCRFRITSQIKYRRRVWGLVKNFIEKNVAAGIRESFSVLVDLLRKESHHQTQMLNVRPCNLARKKVLRRKRTSARTVAKSIAAVDTRHLSCSALPDIPVRHSNSHAILARIKDDWNMQLTFTNVVQVIAGILLVLVIFNCILFYRLWALEASASQLFDSKLSRYDASKISDSPRSGREWVRLLDHQHALHEAEVDQWKEILSTSVELLGQMTRSLSELRSSLDERSVYKRETEESVDQTPFEQTN